MAQNNNNQKRKFVPNKQADPMANSMSMERQAIRYFKDMSYNSFDVYKDGPVFLNENFMTASIKAASDLLTRAIIHRDAMSIAYGGNTDVRILRVYQDDCKKVEGYTMIYNTLQMIKGTGDIGYLLQLVNNLGKFKLNI